MALQFFDITEVGKLVAAMSSSYRSHELGCYVGQSRRCCALCRLCDGDGKDWRVRRWLRRGGEQSSSTGVPTTFREGLIDNRNIRQGNSAASLSVHPRAVRRSDSYPTRPCHRSYTTPPPVHRRQPMPFSAFEEPRVGAESSECFAQGGFIIKGMRSHAVGAGS